MLVYIKDIRVGHRLRQPRPEQVASLADSISRIGLQTPISVVSGVAKREGGGSDVSFELVAGLHRLEACKSLGLVEIEAAIVQMDSDERLLWEIDENLCRADLTELERGVCLLKRKEVCKRMAPRTPSGQFGAAEEKSFTVEVSENTGIPGRTIDRTIRRARRIDEALRTQVAEIPAVADSGVELDALGDLDAVEQRKVIGEIRSGRATTVRGAIKAIVPPRRAPAPMFKNNFKISQLWRVAFLKLIAKATAEDLEWARDQIDRPVADKASALQVVK